MMDALEEMVHKHLTEISALKKANWQIHEQLLDEIAGLVHAPLQMVQDVLLTVSVERNARVGDILDHVHDFLVTLHSYQQHSEQKP